MKENLGENMIQFSREEKNKISGKTETVFLGGKIKIPRGKTDVSFGGKK